MAHPHSEHRAHKHEKARVQHIAGMSGGEPKHYARGGSVHSDEAEDKALIKKSVKTSCMRADGGSVKARADKAPRRARGGHVKGHKGAKTNVNVIVAPSGGQKGPMAGMMPPPPPAAGAMPPPMPPKPPMAPPPMPVGMAGPPGQGMGGMPMRKRGGRVAGLEPGHRHKPDVMRHHAKAGKLEVDAHKGRHRKGTSTLRNQGGKVSDDYGASDMKPAKYGKGEVGDIWGNSEMKAYKRGGAVDGKKSLADKRGVTGIGERTPIQHSGNKSDTQNIGRGPVITRATGGPIYSDGREGVDMGPNLHAGSNSGVGRLARNRLARSESWEA